jgi:hypothetical protein
MPRQVSFNDLFNTTFEEIGANRAACLVFLALAVPLGVLPLVAFDTAVPDGDGVFGLIAAGAVPITLFLAAMLVGMVVQFWFTTAMLRRSLEPDFGPLLAYLGISLLSSFALAVGFLLLVVPGVILLVRWIMVMPLVIENRVPAMDSFAESWARTEGSGWAIFGTLAVLLVVILMLNGAGSVLSGLIVQDARIAAWLIESFASQAGTILSTAAGIAAYRWLGDSTREIEDVFA